MDTPNSPLAEAIRKVTDPASPDFGKCINPECSDPEPHKHFCDDCGTEVPEPGQCWGCYHEDPMNDPRADEDRS